MKTAAKRAPRNSLGMTASETFDAYRHLQQEHASLACAIQVIRRQRDVLAVALEIQILLCLAGAHSLNTGRELSRIYDKKQRAFLKKEARRVLQGKAPEVVW